MLKRSILFTLCCAFACASDPITVDSLFKPQYGIRSITTLSLLTTGNANSYRLYPELTIEGDQTVWNDTKQVSLNQTLMASILPSLDIIGSVGGSFAQKEYTHYANSAYISDNDWKFDSFWLGFVYSAPSIAGFIPQITAQTAIVQTEKVNEESKTFYFKSQSLQAALRSYSDPVVYSVYLGASLNQKRKFDNVGSLKYGDGFYGGVNLSIILSPKITLDMGAEHRFQTPQRLNGTKNSHLYSIPTLSVGTTYSINADTSISFSASAGGSSSAPDSIISFSLWKKF